MDPAFPLRVVVLTPPGRGAVATVRVEGRQACARVDSLFEAVSRRPVCELPDDRLAFGRIRLGNEVCEEVVVRRPEENVVDIHCHGGPAVVERLVDTLTAGGGNRVRADRWLETTYASPIAAAACAALGHARTLRAAAILLDQYHGVLDHSLEEIVDHLNRGSMDVATEQIRRLLAAAACGCHLTRPWQVVLAGRPNVGKSSLINALVGYRRAIVHETPGTTRDSVTARTALNGWPVEFCDTAGLRVAEDEVEQEGIGLAQRRLESASLAVLVFDAAQPWGEEDAELCRQYPGGLFVFNKIDLESASLAGRPEGLPVSAIEGLGIDDLIAAITDRLVPDPPIPGQAVPFLESQRAALQASADALERGDTLGAVSHVAGLLCHKK